MYYNLTDFTSLVNTNFPDNTGQNIDASDLAEVATAFIDSFSESADPLSAYTFKLINSDLDSNLQVTLTHSLNTTQVKIVMYSRDKIKLINRHYDTQIIDADNVLLTLFGGIPINGVYTGIIYVI